jgi:uncharacterized protein (DUF362 family)
MPDPEQQNLKKEAPEKAPVTRRRFLARAAAAGGIAGAAGYLSFAPEEWPLAMRDPDGLRSIPEPDPYTLPDFRVEKPAGAADIAVARGESVEAKLRAAIDAVGGLQQYVRPGETVLIKPNVAFDRAPMLGATSNPEVVGALVRMLYADCKAKEVRVADNPIESPPDCFRKSGIGPAASDAGARIFMPDTNAFRMLHTPGADLIEDWWFFHRPLTGADKVIGLAPVKDHNLCGASIGLKNWYGLLGGARNQFHQDIHGIISDLAIMMRPTLTILDGSHILMRNGPTGGDPSDVKQSNTLLASRDPVAADAWAWEHLLERGRDYPAYLAKAGEKGGGKVDWSGRIREVQV